MWSTHFTLGSALVVGGVGMYFRLSHGARGSHGAAQKHGAGKNHDAPMRWESMVCIAAMPALVMVWVAYITVRSFAEDSAGVVAGQKMSAAVSNTS